MFDPGNRRRGACRALALEITAAPGKHGVPEITFVLRAFGFTAFFGGDTLLIPELGKVAERFPKIDLALVPINGLRAMDEQVVMNADEAGTLVGWLKPRVAVPIHYRFHGSWFTDKFILEYSGTPEQFQAAAKRASEKTIVRVLGPGKRSRSCACRPRTSNRRKRVPSPLLTRALNHLPPKPRPGRHLLPACHSGPAPRD